MLRAALVPILLLLASAAPASAGRVLVTPPVGSTGETVQCLVTFLGDEATSATATLYNGSKIVAAGGSPNAIDPGISAPAVLVGANGFFFCTFEGLTKDMRGYIALSSSGQTLLVLPAGR